MERLTFDGNFCEIAQCREMPCQYGGSCSQRKVWERLKEYEDSGLTPEAVEQLKLASMGKAGGEVTEFDGISIDHLRELVKADKGGLVMVPPCKQGDTVWHVTRFGVKSYRIKKLSKGIYGNWAESYDVAFPFGLFGRTVFLTREEAEAKLKEVQKDDERNVLRVREGV